MKPHEINQTESKTRKSGFFQKVKTLEEANKIIKSVTKFFYILGFLVLIFGISGILILRQESAEYNQLTLILLLVTTIIIAFMFLIFAFRLKAYRSKTAGVFLFILSCFAILDIISTMIRFGAGVNIIFLLLCSIGLLSSIEAIRTVKKYDKLKSEEITKPLTD